MQADMERVLEEHKDWRTIKMQLETQVQKANEAKLEKEKELIKAHSEAQNFQHEYANTKKLLTMAQQVDTGHGNYICELVAFSSAHVISIFAVTSY